MKARARRTLAREARVRGVGLFTGAPGSITLRPGSSGIVFERDGEPPIPAHWRHAFSDPRLPGRNTNLALDPARTPGPGNPGVATVEHVLSAIAGLGVTDVSVRVEGPEVPILDGSSAGFVEAILGAEVVEIPGSVEVFRPARAHEIHEKDAFISASPADALEVEYTLDYAGGPIRDQRARLVVTPEAYTREIAPARTFCLRAEAEAMRAAGLFGHLTARDMLVIGDDGAPIDNAMRFPDEPARHKILDLVGDLALLGAPLAASVVAVRSGHRHTLRLVRALAGAR